MMKRGEGIFQHPTMGNELPLSSEVAGIINLVRNPGEKDWLPSSLEWQSKND
jgi:hypothetical protein